jgi:ribosomal protein L37AE/L43A
VLMDVMVAGGLLAVGRGKPAQLVRRQQEAAQRGPRTRGIERCERMAIGCMRGQRPHHAQNERQRPKQAAPGARAQGLKRRSMRTQPASGRKTYSIHGINFQRIRHVSDARLDATRARRRQASPCAHHRHVCRCPNCAMTNLRRIVSTLVDCVQCIERNSSILCANTRRSQEALLARSRHGDGHRVR